MQINCSTIRIKQLVFCKMLKGYKCLACLSVSVLILVLNIYRIVY
jgi:hypothetical protein